MAKKAKKTIRKAKPAKKRAAPKQVAVKKLVKAKKVVAKKVKRASTAKVARAPSPRPSPAKRERGNRRAAPVGEGVVQAKAPMPVPAAAPAPSAAKAAPPAPPAKPWSIKPPAKKTPTFAKVGVLGAGVMGAAIAAHCANAGIDVVLLDIVPANATDRNVLAKGAIERLVRTRPAPLMHRDFARRITPGNLEDDLKLLADCDWICEAVLERLDVKHKVYASVDKVRKKGSIVTSNTSTIPLNKLVDGLPADFAADFAITHFFNPPRYMRLYELVGGAKTKPEVLAKLREFGDVWLGKEVVPCKDTPGFIANRIGIYWSYIAMKEALDLGLTVEEADSIVGRPMGIPKTGIFGLADLTGIDLAPHVNASMLALLPKTDAFVLAYDAEGKLPKLIQTMIGEGLTGRKGKGGFYRRDKQLGDLSLNLDTGQYRPKQTAELDSARAGRKNLRKLVEHPDKGGLYAWRVASQVLSYAASLVPEIADDILLVDTAMKTGYAWKFGPFEQIDQLGTGWFADKLKTEGKPVPPILEKAAGRPLYRDHGNARQRMMSSGEYADIPVDKDAWTLADLKRGKQPIFRTGSASIWDIGDGVACLEFHAKMNAIDEGIISALREARSIDKKGFKALVIGNDDDNFSVGANVGVALFAANAAMWPVIEQQVEGLQAALIALKYAPFPVVGAGAGMALGGGCEVLLHCDAVQAHAESYMGLVEVGVGLIPAGGGTKELVTRAAALPFPKGPMPPVAKAFESISTAKVGTSAAESRDLLYLRSWDGITMNRRRVLADAKARALELVADYTPPPPPTVKLPGATGRAALDMAVKGFQLQGKATTHDGIVSEALAEVVTGGDVDWNEEVTEKALLALERRAFMNLIRKPATLDRIEHMLTTGKPLRN
jgi:3-hydroxyacyl-CoA dehydrogenase